MTRRDKTTATTDTSGDRRDMTIAEFCEGREPTAEELRDAATFARAEPNRLTAAGPTAALPSTSPLLGVVKRWLQGAESARTAAAVVLQHAEQHNLFAQNGYADIDDFVARELPELGSASAVKKYRQAARALEKYFPDLHRTVVARVTGPGGYTCVPGNLPALPSPSILVALDRALRRAGAEGREALLEEVANRTITVRTLEEFGRTSPDLDSGEPDPGPERAVEDPLVQLYISVLNELDTTWGAFEQQCGSDPDERELCEMFRVLWCALETRVRALCPAAKELLTY